MFYSNFLCSSVSFLVGSPINAKYEVLIFPINFMVLSITIYKIFLYLFRKIKKMKCNNCNSEKIHYLHETEDYYTLDKFKVYFCDSCKLIFSIPNIINLDSYYPKTYRKYVGIVELSCNIKIKILRKKNF